MKQCISIGQAAVSAVFFGLACTGASAKEPEAGYVLISKDLLPVGTELVWESVTAMPSLATTITTGGQTQTGTNTQNERRVEKHTVLTPQKIRLELTDFTQTRSMTMEGKAVPAPTRESPLKGVPVLFERKNDKWFSALEDGSHLSPAQKADAMRFEAVNPTAAAADTAIYGPAPRKLHEHWDIDCVNLPDFMGIARPEGTCSAEFVELGKVGQTLCATIKLTFDLKGVSFTNGMTMSLKGESLIHRSIADHIELDSKMTAEIDMVREIQPGTTMEIHGPATFTHKATITRP